MINFWEFAIIFYIPQESLKKKKKSNHTIYVFLVFEIIWFWFTISIDSLGVVQNFQFFHKRIKHMLGGRWLNPLTCFLNSMKM